MHDMSIGLQTRIAIGYYKYIFNTELQFKPKRMPELPGNLAARKQKKSNK